MKNFRLIKKTNKAIININNDELQNKVVQEIIKIPEIKTLTLNSQTYNIKQLSNLELRNAIDYIPKVSFLLSNILVKAGETIDLGSKGLYKVTSGDTLSTIAQKNGFITKDLLKLNPHLIDEGRLKFSQNKVLISANPSNLNNKNHTLQGDDNAENILIDANGGDNIEFINLSLVA